MLSARAFRKRRRRIAYIVLTFLLSLGLLGTSIGWFLDRSYRPAPQEGPTLEQVLSELESQAQANPQDAALAARLARAYWEAGKMEEAEKAYQKAVDLSPEDGGLRIELALVQFLLGRADQAAAGLAEEIKRHPERAETYYYYAQVLALGKGDYRGGIEAMEKFIQLSGGQGEDVARARQMVEEWRSMAGEKTGEKK
ncbi:tetratricopeptide repeat protein [Desulfovirgula thermocuniculi]|uniref:tetratricopeptide repeat protein n=1 Tax=Desulfovirgula thermocuniculi TaxID=348842 RepID=UPI0003F4FB75|nr:tetratricopeptide repeat protein [Desulfovirgula thermocuniculi]